MDAITEKIELAVEQTAASYPAKPKERFTAEEKKGLSLIWAIRKMDYNFAQQILNMSPNLTVADGYGMTALHHAAANGSRPLVLRLIKIGGCDYMAVNKRGRYPFELAMEDARDVALAKLLIKKQAQQADRLRLPAYQGRL